MHGAGVLRVWDIDSGELSAELTGHTRSVSAVAFGPGPGELVSGSTLLVSRLSIGR